MSDAVVAVTILRIHSETYLRPKKGDRRATIKRRQTDQTKSQRKQTKEKEGRGDTWSLLIVIQWQGAPVEIQMTKILLWLPRSRLSSQCDRQGYQEPLSFGRQLVDSHAKKRGGGATFLLG
ncbi:hypothetical protein QLX08_000602 [Tetragonisca angustula]|uniref:Uncharacterized protein n=1 Tax=Tetragonisca angustula TaxID=166442 RepID=A0AAW1AML0_9HYME